MTMDKAITLIGSFIMAMGLPIVHFYLEWSEHPFLNVSLEEGSYKEKISNILLAPYQYIFAGKEAYKLSETTNDYSFKERFDYQNGFELKTAAFLFLLPKTIHEAVFFKAFSFIFDDERKHYRAIKESLDNQNLISNNDYYRQSGLELETLPFLEQKKFYIRRPGDENHLQKEKEALRKIIEIFDEAKIFHFVDCGTCLGAYRYGGVIPWDNDVDIAILTPDFENAKKALKKHLDPNLYLVEDWSSRGKKDSYLKVYVKDSATLIDIYTYTIDPKTRTLRYILSNEDNVFLPKVWKDKERKYKEPISFDLIFPLKKGTFDGINVRLPNKTEEFLKVRYGDNIEPNMIYDPDTKSYIKDLNHPYWNPI